MKDGVRLFAKALQKINDEIPDGMSLVEWKRLREAQETERYLARGQSIREPIEDSVELAMLFRRGDLVKGKDLAAKLAAEQEAQKQFEEAAEAEIRNQRFKSPRATTKNTTPVWKREPFEG